jgi:hypothetical protein
MKFGVVQANDWNIEVLKYGTRPDQDHGGIRCSQRPSLPQRSKYIAPSYLKQRWRKPVKMTQKKQGAGCEWHGVLA